MSTPAVSPSGSTVVSPFKPRAGDVILAVVSLRRALNVIAEDLASVHGIQLALPELSPLPHWVRPRPLICIGPVPGGYGAVPLTTFNGEPPETLDLLLQNIVAPLGEAASVLPFFKGKTSFQTKPRWKHREDRPAYVIPARIIIPETFEMYSAHRFMPARTLDRLLTHFRDTLGALARLAKEELETILDSYTQATYDMPLYPALPEPHDPETPLPVDQDVPLPTDQDAAPLDVQVATSVPPASPPVALNPLAATFTPTLHPCSGGLDLLDLVSRFSLVAGVSSDAQQSILSVLHDNARLPASDAPPPPQRKVRQAHIDDIAEKENRAP